MTNISWFPPDSRGDIFISYFLQPFIGRPGQDVSFEHKQRHFKLTLRHGRQGSWRCTFCLFVFNSAYFLKVCPENIMNVINCAFNKISV